MAIRSLFLVGLFVIQIFQIVVTGKTHQLLYCLHLKKAKQIDNFKVSKDKTGFFASSSTSEETFNSLMISNLSLQEQILNRFFSTH